MQKKYKLIIINILLIIFLNINYNYISIEKKILLIGDWGLGIGDWGLGIGDWAQIPIPNPHPQSPIPKKNIFYYLIKNFYYYLFKLIIPKNINNLFIK